MAAVAALFISLIASIAQADPAGPDKRIRVAIRNG
jgi:hypothetical protein